MGHAWHAAEQSMRGKVQPAAALLPMISEIVSQVNVPCAMLSNASEMVTMKAAQQGQRCCHTSVACAAAFGILPSQPLNELP